MKGIYHVSIRYTEATIYKKILNSSKDMSTFYQQDFVNYQGCTSDTGVNYTELVAQWLCGHIELLKKIPVITRKKSYKTQNHKGVINNYTSPRTEELIAKGMFQQKTLSLLGEIIDYQTPLKNQQNDRAGKIDLLAYDGSILRILELKKPDSNESMLRCVLEGYTYLQTVDDKKLLADFSLPIDTSVVACPFVYHGGIQFQEMKENRPYLIQLMERLDSIPFYISKKDDIYLVTGE